MADNVTWNGDGDGVTWSDGDNWDTDSPPGDGENAVVDVGATVVFDEDHSAGGRNIQLSGVNNAGTVTHKTDGNTHLRIANGGVLNIGAAHKWSAGTPGGTQIGEDYTAKISFAPASNGNCSIYLTAGAEFLGAGTNTWGRGGAEWVATLLVQASATTDILVLDTASDWVPQITDDSFVVLIETTGAWNEFDIGTIKAYDAGTHRITLTTALTNTHLAGARVFAVSRNVHVFSETEFGWTLNAAIGSVTLAETYFEKCYRNLLEADEDSFDHCAFRGIGSDYIWYDIGSTNDRFYWNDTLLFDAERAYHNMTGINVGNELHIQACIYAFYTTIMQKLEMTGGSIIVHYYPLMPYRAARATLTGTYIRTNNFLGAMSAELINCVIDIPIMVVRQTDYGASFHLHNCLFPDSATLANTYQAYVVSTNHNRVPGAAKIWTQGSTLQKQSEVALSGNALQVSPGNRINANLPLWVKLADIACKGGDIITVSAWCQVDAAYGTANDPSLVLDRGDSNGVESEQTFAIAAADTWTQATISDKTVSGDADDDLLVGLWLKVPHYAAGADVFVDKIEVSGASVPAQGEFDNWPYEQFQPTRVQLGAFQHPFK
ncbi:MAG: hypothetical protein HQ592_03985 [Planctomycetes bacterium]|nr:hypothetical protein [Planctomycetota bacterium]